MAGGCARPDSRDCSGRGRTTPYMAQTAGRAWGRSHPLRLSVSRSTNAAGTLKKDHRNDAPTLSSPKTRNFRAPSRGTRLRDNLPTCVVFGQGGTGERHGLSLCGRDAVAPRGRISCDRIELVRRSKQILPWRSISRFRYGIGLRRGSAMNEKLTQTT